LVVNLQKKGGQILIHPPLFILFFQLGIER